MLELIFFVLMILIFGKLFIFAVKASWGIAKILLTIVALPVILIFMVLGGLLSIAVPLLAIVGVVSLVCGRR